MKFYIAPSQQRWLHYCRMHYLDPHNKYVVYSAKHWMRVCGVERSTEIIVTGWPIDSADHGQEFEGNVRARFVNVTEVF